MEKILIDTDVVLDLFFDRKPFSDYAGEVFALCETGQISGFLTPVIFSNVYYLLRKTAGHKKVVGKLKELLMITDVLQMDKKVVSDALHSGFNDFEDGLQYFAANRKGGIQVILTRNIKDYRQSKISCMTPETYVKTR
jgi:predicted nucleic acid-binding protein